MAKAKISATSKKAISVDAVKLKQCAINLYYDKKYCAAENIFKSYLVHHEPYDAQALLFMGRTKFKLEDYEGAAKYAKFSLEFSDGNNTAAALKLCAVASEYKKDHQTAIKHYKIMKLMYPRIPGITTKIAVNLFKQGHCTQALDHFLEASLEGKEYDKELRYIRSILKNEPLKNGNVRPLIASRLHRLSQRLQDDGTLLLEVNRIDDAKSYFVQLYELSTVASPLAYLKDPYGAGLDLWEENKDEPQILKALFDISLLQDKKLASGQQKSCHYR